jgi:hypothetical protein
VTQPDYKSWFADSLPKFENIRDARVFRFVLKDNLVQLSVRNDMATTNINQATNGWFPEGGYTIVSQEKALEIWNRPMRFVPLRPLPIDDITATIDKYEAANTTTAANIAVWRERIAEMTNVEADECVDCLRIMREDAATNQV